MRPTFVACTSLLCLVTSYNGAQAFKLGGPGGTCPKDPKVQCQVICDNGQVADYMKWTGSAWSDMVGRTKDADVNGEAGKLVAKSNSDSKLTGGAASCK